MGQKMFEFFQILHSIMFFGSLNLFLRLCLVSTLKVSLEGAELRFALFSG